MISNRAIPRSRRLRRRCLGEGDGRRCVPARAAGRLRSQFAAARRTRLLGGSPDREAAFLMPADLMLAESSGVGIMGKTEAQPLRGRPPAGAPSRTTDRHADTGPGFRSRTPPALGLVAHLVQLALSRNRRRCDRERSQHRAGGRSLDPQRRHRAQRADPRSVLRPGPPFARARPPRLCPRHRARPLALSDPARPQARPAAQLAGLVPRRRRPPLSSRRRRVSLRVRARQFLRLFRAPRGRSCRPRSGQARLGLGRRAGHGSDGRRLDAPALSTRARGNGSTRTISSAASATSPATATG